MKAQYTVALAMLAGFGLGAVAVQGLHAQAKPPVYYVAEIDVTNPDAYGQEYAPKAQAIIKAAGGRFLAIGGAAGGAKVTAFDGEAPKRVVVQVWDSMEKIQAWRANRNTSKPGKSVRNTQNSAPSPSRACRNNTSHCGITAEAAAG